MPNDTRQCEKRIAAPCNTETWMNRTWIPWMHTHTRQYEKKATALFHTEKSIHLTSIRWIRDCSRVQAAPVRGPDGRQLDIWCLLVMNKRPLTPASTIICRERKSLPGIPRQQRRAAPRYDVRSGCCAKEHVLGTHPAFPLWEHLHQMNTQNPSPLNADRDSAATNGRELVECIQGGWFMERSPLWPGQALALEVQRVLYQGRSRFQDILVFDSRAHGRVLVLDGAIQVTERDEFAYQEMITHLPMFAHPRPERVLVVGGGDGGVLREVLRHDAVDKMLEKVVLCELDEDVIRVSRDYLPGVSGGALDGTNAKVSIAIMDGAAFMQQHQSQFDVIITDSSDPLGPAESLYQEPFFRSMYAALREGGIACVQGESFWLHLDLIVSVVRILRSIFDVVEYASASVPTYPSGQIGFLLCGKGTVWRNGGRPRHAARRPSEKLQRHLRYYSPEMHESAFVLPPFVEKAIAGALQHPLEAS